MKITFLGTKGGIEEKTRKHKYNASLLIEYKGFKLMVDHGLESIPLAKTRPDAILITHGHWDHFKWGKEDEKYESMIYVARETKRIAKFKKNFKIIKLDKQFKVGPFKIIAYRVIHSLRCPAVGFKIRNKKTIVYNPDLIAIKNKSVLRNVDLYVGDGASLRGNLVRRKNDKLFGHTRMKTQVNWCRKYGIKKMIFTHLGKNPLSIGDKNLEKALREEDIEVRIAHDGMVI